MAKAQPLTIGDHRFERKSDALDFMKAMLNRYRPGDRVSPPDQAFMAVALLRHPEAEAKVGAGVEYFEVRAADYGTQCFWVIRKDGSEARFSYKSCA